MKKIIMSIGLFCMIALSVLSYHSEAEAAKKVELNKKKITVAVDGKQTLKLNGVNKKKVTWKSKNKKIATVNKNGKIVGKKAGKTKVYAQVKGKSKKYTCTVTVKAVALDYQKISLNVGNGKTLKVNGAKAPSVKWTSKNKKIATVSQSGKVVGKKAGTTTIYATVYGKKMSCEVVVVPKGEATEEDVETEDKDGDGTKDEEVETGAMTVTISAPTTTINGYDTVQLSLDIQNNDITNVTAAEWRVCSTPYGYPDHTKGTIDANGLFTSNGMNGQISVFYGIRGYRADGSYNMVTSNIVTLTINSNFTYELQPLSNFYNSSLYGNGWTSAGAGAVYIKTNDTQFKDMYFALYDKNNEMVVDMGYHVAATCTPYRFENLKDEYDNYGEYFDMDKMDNCWIGGGMTTIADTGSWHNIPSGDYYLALAKRVETVNTIQYIPLATTPIHIYDMEEEFKKWADNFLATYTTDDMNVHEKMEKMVEYMNTYSFHLTFTDRTQDIGLCFLSGCTDSIAAPRTLIKFGEYIGYSNMTCDVLETYKPEAERAHTKHGSATGFYDVDGDGVVDTNFYKVSNGVTSGDNDDFYCIQDSLQSLIDTYKNQWIEE